MKLAVFKKFMVCLIGDSLGLTAWPPGAVKICNMNRNKPPQKHVFKMVEKWAVVKLFSWYDPSRETPVKYSRYLYNYRLKYI